jgi:hypothetical protein
MTAFLRADTTLQADIWNNNWRALRTNRALLTLATNPEFLHFAQLITTPIHKARAEEPTERFRELSQ